MRLYLMRHGEAVPPGPRVQDEDRPLTPEGRRRVRELARAWSRRDDPIPEVWVVSPLVRAVQTCEICLAEMGPDTPVEISRRLLPTGRVSFLLDLIEERGEGAVALVGHQPLLGGLGVFLLGWPSVPAELEPGAVLALDMERPGEGTLVWHAIPARDDRGPLFLEPPSPR
ncbi:MAG: histidine phosphatase family protein [Pseudomonadota bacterium]